LWHKGYRENFVVYAGQGRFVSGWMIERCFGALNQIAQLKMLRVISLFGWLGIIALWQYLFTQWNKYLQLPKAVLIFSSIFLACTPSVAMYIGWASCFEVFLGYALALLSGHLLFSTLMKQQDHIEIPFSKMALITFLGLTSLFIYQTCFGAFLLPFALFFVFEAKLLNKKVIIGGVFYVMISGLYLFLFKYSLSYFHIPPSDRTEISINVLSKISFFFSQVLSQSFSFNFLYNFHSIFSQAFYPLCVALLMLLAYRQNKKVTSAIGIVIGVLATVGLMYMPVMAARENFASYRTMLAPVLLVSTVVFRLLYKFMKDWRFSQIALGLIIIVITVTGFYNFNYQFRKPLQHEYAHLRAELNRINFKQIDTLTFIRPQEKAFHDKFHVNAFTDEFGMPSTYKDWTADPLIRQVIVENYGDRKLANALSIIQKNSSDAVPDGLSDKHILIQMDSAILKD
jgi:hypothetical protein